MLNRFRWQKVIRKTEVFFIFMNNFLKFASNRSVETPFLDIFFYLIHLVYNYLHYLMSQSARTIAGILFLLLSVTAITLIRINPAATTPTRSTETRHAGIIGGLVQGFITTQELTAIKDYISGVDLYFTQGGRNNTNENTLLLLDATYKTLYKKSFSSTEVVEGAPTPLMFDKSIYIGKGNLLYLCVFSNDGTQDNRVSLLVNQSDSIGPLYISNVTGSDLGSSLKNKVQSFKGSLIIRTYGSDSSQFWLMKVVLYILGAIVSCLIIWFTWVRSTLARIRIIPEWIFLIIALPVSTVFALITPPLQVPDEGSHFLRAYGIAEFDLFHHNKTGPVSILKLDSAFGRLHFSAGEKTSMAEIKQHSGTRLEPQKRGPVTPPEYTLPYLPQALGIFTGKIFDVSPLTLMYLGRLFNLVISILLMFYAIRIIPQFKWIFLLLALMPKTLFLFGSLSYDSLTISLSFFTIAIFFFYAFACERDLKIKDLALIALLVLLLLFCKPPYFILGLLFFFIPPKKIGYLYKYIMISAGVVVLALVIFKVGPATVSYISSPTATRQVIPADTSASSANLPIFRPEEQISTIMNDIPAYLKLIFKSGFDKNRSYILDSFVGLLGWIDVELPAMLTYSYLLLLLFSAVVLSHTNFTLGLTKKSLLLFLLFVSYAVIHTAMFLYATRPGRDQVFGVQGRYFIPMAPLLFMLFYNRYFSGKLNLLFSMRRKEYNNAKAKGKPAIYNEIMDTEQLFDKSLYLFLTCFCVFTLLYSIYITLIRYYNI
jgi:uncharacterized membrane protein